MTKITLFSILAASLCSATPELSPIFQSGMMFQREKPIPVWGTADAGEKVSIAWQGKQYQAIADTQGAWTLQLAPSKASAAGSRLLASDSTGKVELKDIIIGDLWLASGQSNMQRPMSLFKDTKGMSQEMSNPKIRILQIDTMLATDGKSYSLDHYNKVEQQGGVSFTWKSFTPQNALGFSAVASTFANYVQEDSGVPIGIIGNAVGGSGVESWLPQSLIDSKPMYESLRAGDWMDATNFSAWMRGRAALNLKNVIASGTVAKEDLDHPFKPAYLFERATAPLTPLPIKGVIWYQGESNAEDPDMERNAAMIQDMIAAWRKAFNNDQLPFFTVQLPRIKDTTTLRAPWAYFREAQDRVAAKDPYTEIICTLDLGEANNDVHPSPKAPVGRRLANIVLNKCYGKKLPTSPRITAMKSTKDGVMLKASQALTTTKAGEEVKGFKVCVAGCDSPQDVSAQIKGDIIKLTFDKGQKDKATIQYNFDVYCEPNVVGKDGGLPLFPWRSYKD